MFINRRPQVFLEARYIFKLIRITLSSESGMCGESPKIEWFPRKTLWIRLPDILEKWGRCGARKMSNEANTLELRSGAASVLADIPAIFEMRRSSPHTSLWTMCLTNKNRICCREFSWNKRNCYISSTWGGTDSLSASSSPGCLYRSSKTAVLHDIWAFAANKKEENRFRLNFNCLRKSLT